MSAPLIVVDTNALHRDPYLTGSHVSTLLSLARRSRVSLAIPDVVLRELHRQQRSVVAGRVEYLQKAEARLRDALKVLRLSAAEYPVQLADFDHLLPDRLLDEIFEDVRSRLVAGFVEVLPIPAVSHDSMLARDLEARAPFDQSGKGYRDALIWHSLLERLQDAEVSRDVYLVTNDDDFGDGESLHPDLLAELPFGARVTKVASIADLLAKPAISTLNADLQEELEEVALARMDADLRAELSTTDTHRAMSEAAEEAVRSAIDSLGLLALSYMQCANLRIPREFEDVDLVGAIAHDGDFDWVLYDQLDGDTLLGRGTMTAEVEFSAVVDKSDAGVLADPEVHVEAWEIDTAHVTFWRNARLTFDVRIDLAASVQDASLSDIEAAD